MKIRKKVSVIGSTSGVLVPKNYLDLCGIKGEVEINVSNNVITIVAVPSPWREDKVQRVHLAS